MTRNISDHSGSFIPRTQTSPRLSVMLIQEQAAMYYPIKKLKNSLDRNDYLLTAVDLSGIGNLCHYPIDR